MHLALNMLLHPEFGVDATMKGSAAAVRREEVPEEGSDLHLQPCQDVPGRLQGGNLFDKPSFVQVVTYDAVTTNTVYSPSLTQMCEAMESTTYAISISAMQC